MTTIIIIKGEICDERAELGADGIATIVDGLFAGSRYRVEGDQCHPVLESGELTPGCSWGPIERVGTLDRDAD